MWFPIIITLLSGYMLGNLNGSVSISTLVEKDDVRNHGSGNAGLTNFFRNFGGWNTLLVFAVDFSKAALACYVGGLLLEPHGFYQEGQMLGAIAVTLGHDFPILLGLKGGKGILCGFTIALVIDWRIALIILGVFILLYGTTKFVSLGSVGGSAMFIVGFAIFHYDNIWLLLGGITLGLLAIYMHRENIKRLVKGTESKVYLSKKNRNKK